jgi:hypothetical protein
MTVSSALQQRRVVVGGLVRELGAPRKDLNRDEKSVGDDGDGWKTAGQEDQKRGWEGGCKCDWAPRG